MIEYVKSGIIGKWEIMSVGIAEEKCGAVVYRSVDDLNIERNDRVGEFLNRPLFIMKSVK